MILQITELQVLLVLVVTQQPQFLIQSLLTCVPEKAVTPDTEVVSTVLLVSVCKCKTTYICPGYYQV